MEEFRPSFCIYAVSCQLIHRLPGFKTGGLTPHRSPGFGTDRQMRHVLAPMPLVRAMKADSRLTSSSRNRVSLWPCWMSQEGISL